EGRRIFARVRARELLVELEGAAHRLHGLRKFGEKTAERARKAAPGMRRNDFGRGTGEEAAPALERALLVALHEARGVERIGDEDRAAQPLRAGRSEAAPVLLRHEFRRLLGPRVGNELL